MSVEWCRETSRDAEYSGEDGGETTATRSWLAKTSAATTSPLTIAASAGVSMGDGHPDDPELKASRFRVRASDSSGLLWTVTWEYKPQPEKEAEEPGELPGGLPGKPPVWGGSSSVTTIPIYQDRFGNTIVNTAGDPLEDLTAEAAEERLTLTQYYASHADWMPLARQFTNAINSDAWNGGDAFTWKCQGCSKKLNFNKTEQGTEVYWEVTWEFAYRKDGWDPKPWNIGFHELVDEDGVPTAYGENRAVIKSHGGKGTRQPVALNPDGTAKPAGEPPDVLFVDYYSSYAFDPVFGQVFTPGQ